MEKFLKTLLLFLAMAGLVSCQSFVGPKRLVEFEVRCPKGTEPHGICFAEYQGKEIVVCCIWKRCSIFIQGFQGYDLQGKQLQIPQEELGNYMENILGSIKFKRQYVLETRREPWILALLDKCIRENGECCSHSETRKRLTLANAVWKMPLEHYTNHEKGLAGNSYYTAFDINRITFPNSSRGDFPPVFTVEALTFQPYLYHIWGIDGLTGKELVYYCSSKCGKSTDKNFVPHSAILDSTLQHIAIQGGGVRAFTGQQLLLFYVSPEKFVNGQSCFQYDVTEGFVIDDEDFFLSSDIFCFALNSHAGLRGLNFNEQCHVLLYCFSENRIVGSLELSHRLSSPCKTWYQPWCDVSRDGKRLAIGFERTNSLKPVSSRDDFQTWVRVYQLEP